MHAFRKGAWPTSKTLARRYLLICNAIGGRNFLRVFDNIWR
jgi:hypothetical protein